MLKYHLLLPNITKQTTGLFQHYLHLGNHSSPYELDRIQSLSIITLNPKEKLPQINNNAEGKYSTALIPLKGKLRVDGQDLQSQSYDKLCIFWNPKNIGTVNDDDKCATFIYLAVEGVDIKTVNIELKRYEEDTVIDSNLELIYVIDGRAVYCEENIEVNLKNKMNFQEVQPIFYSAEPIKIKIMKNTLILKISDSL